MFDNIGGLLSNKWVLYGGAGVAALIGVYLLTSGGSTATEEEFMTDGSLYPAMLAPVGVPTSGGGTGDQGLDLGALIALESKKADFGREVSLAEIDASLKTNLQTVSANLQLGLRQADSLDLMSFADIFGSASKLYLANTNAVAGAFNYNGKSFDFSTVRIAGMPTNERAIDAISQYRQQANAPTGGSNVGSSNSLATNAGQLRVAGAPTSSTAGRASSVAAPVASGLGALASRLASVGAVATPSANRVSGADRQRL